MVRRYFKRFRMEVDLGRAPAPSSPPEGYDFLAWDPALLEHHAYVKYCSFHDELDATVFSCLGDPLGCLQLMRDISQCEDFLPAATWLAVHYGPQGPEFCGTIQGVRGRLGVGSVQNVGTLVGHRGCGVGTGLILRALDGFRRMGLQRGMLEVTVQNQSALRLYRNLGFRHTQTVYKSAEIAYT